MEVRDIYGMEHYRREDQELELSACQQLDYHGMQPHSREHLEHEVNCARSWRAYQKVEGEMMDYTPGIHFGATP